MISSFAVKILGSWLILVFTRMLHIRNSAIEPRLPLPLSIFEFTFENSFLVQFRFPFSSLSTEIEACFSSAYVI